MARLARAYPGCLEAKQGKHSEQVTTSVIVIV